jgi:predicted ATPase
LIKSLIVRGLNGRENYNLVFYEDINIFTGRNGAGKTTILKMIWYLISGNIERALEEIDFEYAYLEADTFQIEVQNSKESPDIAHIKYTVNNKTEEANVLNDDRRFLTPRTLDVDKIVEINKINVAISEAADSSIFFPTFRRIEGGFSISKKKNGVRNGVDIEEAFNSVSSRISVKNHKFITSVSTVDITNLLNEKFANVSEQTNKLHSQLTKHIENEIDRYTRQKNKQSDKNQLDTANEILDSIHHQLNLITEQNALILEPFNVLSELTQTIFQHKGIRVSSAITLGDTKEAMLSDKLSAGEKQMLSFLCYNAFSSNCPIFIDEPEISLHVDWQRALFPTLMKQSKNNQFFIATHSPFIYSKYEDRELILNEDRGGY